jgi:transcription termination factor Rho
MGTELDEPLFWQYMAIRQRRNNNTSERRRKSFLVCLHISIAKREALAEYNVLPVEATAKDFFKMLDTSVTQIPSREVVLRNLDPSLEVLFDLEREGMPSSEIRVAENFLSIFRPVRPQMRTASRRSHFLLGSPPSWDDIHCHLDADREISEEVHHVIKEELVSNRDRTALVILSGAARSEKTTIAKRISITLADEGFSVYFADKEVRPQPEQITTYLRRIERKVVLTFDEAIDDLRVICEMVIASAGFKYNQ